MDVRIQSDENHELSNFLGDQLYLFNAEKTGIADGELLWASVTNDAGTLIAGIAGHTWGGCCEIGRLWVHAAERGKGLGASLMAAAEREAVRRGCTQIVLSTHSFQAPAFYEKLGFARLAAVPDYPRGHEHIIYLKQLSREVAVGGDDSTHSAETKMLD